MNKGIPPKTVSRNFTSKETVVQYIESAERKKINQSILYPDKLSFRVEGNVKSSEDKQIMKELITTIPALHEMLKGLL